MPGAGRECVIEVGDETVLSEIEFYLAEQLGPDDAPQFERSEGCGGAVRRRSDGGRGGLAPLPPCARENQLGVDTVLVWLPERDDQAVPDSFGDVFGT